MRSASRVMRRADRQASGGDELKPGGTISRAMRLRFWLIGLLRSFLFAFAGIGWMVRTQRNAQVHVFITTVVVIAGFVLQVSTVEWLALILSIAVVLAFEALNSAVEAVVDLASPQLHLLAKRAKDAAAGAVLLVAIGAALVGCIIFLPKLLRFVGLMT